MRNWVILRQNSTLQSAGLCWKHDKLTLSLNQMAKMMLQRYDRRIYHRYVCQTRNFGEGGGGGLEIWWDIYATSMRILLTVINRSTIIKKNIKFFNFLKLNY